MKEGSVEVKAAAMAIIVPVLLVLGGTLLMVLEGVLHLILTIQRCRAFCNTQMSYWISATQAHLLPRFEVASNLAERKQNAPNQRYL